MLAQSPTLFDVPPIAHTRHSMPETSREAALTVNVTEGQAAILRAMQALRGMDIPATDERIYNWLKVYHIAISESGARTRRSELVTKGKVKFSGRFGETASKRNTRIWELVK